MRTRCIDVYEENKRFSIISQICYMLILLHVSLRFQKKTRAGVKQDAFTTLVRSKGTGQGMLDNNFDKANGKPFLILNHILE